MQTSGLEFAYSLGSSSITPVKEFQADVTYTPKRFDLVKLVNGKVVAAVATDATVLGVCEGPNFTGLIAGVPVVSTYNPGTLAHVRTSNKAVYRIPLKAGAAAPTIGTKYGIDITNGKITLDTANTATAAIYQVEDYNADTGKAFVRITSLSNE